MLGALSLTGSTILGCEDPSDIVATPLDPEADPFDPPLPSTESDPEETCCEEGSTSFEETGASDTIVDLEPYKTPSATIEIPNRAGSPFATSSAFITHNLNRFWKLYGLVQDDDGNYISPNHGNTAWVEWGALKYAWLPLDNPRKSAGLRFVPNSVKVNGVNAEGDQPFGYVWSWTGRERWPDHRASTHASGGSFHFDQIPRVVNAAYLYWQWTRDIEYLRSVMPQLEGAMGYMLNEIGGSSGLLKVRNPGTSNGRPSTYFDQIRSGHEDGWVNVTFYTALESMRDIYRVFGEDDKAAIYDALVKAFPKNLMMRCTTKTRVVTPVGAIAKASNTMPVTHT
ncbi:MAG: hypothetical protein R3A47_08590 [Polyangiales bacterium]